MQYPGRVGPLVNDQAPFSEEMVAGNVPDRPRVFKNHSLFQPVFAPLPNLDFAPESINVVQPDSKRVFKNHSLFTSSFQPVDISTFTFEAIGASPVVSPRVFKSSRIFKELFSPPPNNDFAFESVGFIGPYKPSVFRRQIFSQPPFDFAQESVFSMEMVLGNVAARTFKRFMQGPRVEQTMFDVAQLSVFSSEQVLGNAPPRKYQRRLFLPSTFDYTHIAGVSAGVPETAGYTVNPLANLATLLSTLANLLTDVDDV